MKKLYIGLAALIIVTAVVIGLVTSQMGKHTTMKSMTSNQTAVMTNTVNIKNYMFSPMAIKVKVGTKVTWTNQDSVAHTITADDTNAAAPSSMDIADGQSYSFTFTKAGTYTYHCFPHPYMHGTVEVIQ